MSKRYVDFHEMKGETLEKQSSNDFRARRDAECEASTRPRERTWLRAQELPASYVVEWYWGK